jgi:hypothetical protein
VRVPSGTSMDNQSEECGDWEIRTTEDTGRASPLVFTAQLSEIEVPGAAWLK